MDTHERKIVAESVEKNLSELVRNKLITDYSATMRMDGEVNVIYILNRPIKFIKTNVKLSKQF